MIQFSSVAKRYPGGEEALSGVTAAVAEGEMVAVTGHSGAGKSTLLKLIPAIERPSAGSVIVNGQNVGALKRAAIPYLRRNVGLVFQDQKLLYDRSVFDNIMLPLAFSGHTLKEAARRARAALDKVGLLAEKTFEEELEEVREGKVWKARVFDAGFGWITGPSQYGGRELPSSYERAWQAESVYSSPKVIVRSAPCCSYCSQSVSRWCSRATVAATASCR